MCDRREIELLQIEVFRLAFIACLSSIFPLTTGRLTPAARRTTKKARDWTAVRTRALWIRGLSVHAPLDTLLADFLSITSAERFQGPFLATPVWVRKSYQTS